MSSDATVSRDINFPAKIGGDMDVTCRDITRCEVVLHRILRLNLAGRLSHDINFPSKFSRLIDISFISRGVMQYHASQFQVVGSRDMRSCDVASRDMTLQNTGSHKFAR